MKVPINKFLHELSVSRNKDKIKLVFLSIGNPAQKYANTRHNAGHEVLQAAVRYLGGASSNSTGNATIGEFSNYRNVYFAESSTFMNESGKALRDVLNKVKGEEIKIIIVHDDMALEPGEVKFKLASKAAGGHNGLKDIVKYGEFPRLRVGIGAPPAMDSRSVTKFVLGKFRPIEKKAFDEGIPETVAIIKQIASALDYKKPAA